MGPEQTMVAAFRAPARPPPIMSAQRGTLRLAVIDREPALLKVLGKRLDAAGWEHRVLPGGAPVEELVAMKLNAIVVDLTVLGPEEGWEFLERVAGMLPGLGVIVCTSNSTVAQRVRGPAPRAPTTGSPSPATRRRSWPGSRPSSAAAAGPRPESEQGPIVVGELEIRDDQFQAYVAGRTLDLTRREFELLNTLAEAAGKVLEREEIYRRVWGYEMAHGDRSVDVFVRKLRSKIQKHSPGWDYIHTHFGIGYRFEAGGCARRGARRSTRPPSSPVEAEIEPDARLLRSAIRRRAWLHDLHNLPLAGVREFTGMRPAHSAPPGSPGAGAPARQVSES